jgi:hypothetical protein
MKRVAVAFALASTFALVASSRVTLGQGNGNPFTDHSDTGETVHILPAPAAIRSPHATQPSDRPNDGLHVYAASYGSGNLTNHGGHEIPFAGFYAIFWNSMVANSAGSQGYSTLQAQVAEFAQTFSDGAAYSQSDTAADYTIVTQYSATDTIQPSLAYVGATVDNQATQSSISDSRVRSYLAGFFNAHPGVSADSDTVYGVYFPHGMKITLQGGASCSAFCGYHSHFTYNGKTIRYAVFPYTDCRACSLTGKAAADILTIVTSHEIREAVTDADGSAWYDGSGYEADDKCAWHNLYQMSRGGKSTFWVQPEYSNGGGAFPGPGCVVPLP